MHWRMAQLAIYSDERTLASLRLPWFLDTDVGLVFVKRIRKAIPCNAKALLENEQV